MEIPRLAATVDAPVSTHGGGAYALGYVDDLRDPLDVLLGRQDQTGLGNMTDAAKARARGTQG